MIGAHFIFALAPRGARGPARALFLGVGELRGWPGKVGSVEAVGLLAVGGLVLVFPFPGPYLGGGGRAQKGATPDILLVYLYIPFSESRVRLQNQPLARFCEQPPKLGVASSNLARVTI